MLAEFYGADGVAISNAGDIFISDQGNQRIRLVTLHPEEVNKTSISREGLAVNPIPSSGIINIIVAAEIEEIAKMTITNLLGEKVSEFSVLTNTQKQIEHPLMQGIYFLTATTPSHNYTQKIVIQ